MRHNKPDTPDVLLLHCHPELQESLKNPMLMCACSPSLETTITTFECRQTYGAPCCMAGNWHSRHGAKTMMMQPLQCAGSCRLHWHEPGLLSAGTAEKCFAIMTDLMYVGKAAPLWERANVIKKLQLKERAMAYWISKQFQDN
jgi:hypothetical protein